MGPVGLINRLLVFKGIMKYIIALLSSILSLTSQANEGVDINSLKESAKTEITRSYPKTTKSKLVFVDLAVDTKSKKLKEIYLELSFVDKASLHSDEYSKYAYDRYIVSFSILSGGLEKVVKGGWGSYQEIENNVIK